MTKKHNKKVFTPLFIWLFLTTILMSVSSAFFHTDTWWLNVVRNGLCLYASIIVGHFALRWYYKGPSNKRQCTK